MTYTPPRTEPLPPVRFAYTTPRHLWLWDQHKELAYCGICGTTRQLAKIQGIMDRCPGRGQVDGDSTTGIGSQVQGGQHPGA